MKTKRQKQLFKRLDILMTIRDKWIEKNNLKDNQKNFVNHDQSKWLKTKSGYKFDVDNIPNKLLYILREFYKLHNSSKTNNAFCQFGLILLKSFSNGSVNSTSIQSFSLHQYSHAFLEYSK